MDSDAIQPALIDRLWVWGEKNKKQLLFGFVAVLVVGLGIAFWLVHQNESQTAANDALSKLTSRVSANAPEPSSDALLKVVAEYPSTPASQRAELLAAASLFDAGQYDQAQARFQNFLRDNGDSPFAPQASIGVAACLDAQNKTNDAVAAYQNVTEHYPMSEVIGQARLALGRLLAAQGKFRDAKNAFEQLRGFPGSISSEATIRLQELMAAHPELAPTNTPATGGNLDSLRSTIIKSGQK
jgi:predicted negative regulator of RcsB-dependent stress response